MAAPARVVAALAAVAALGLGSALPAVAGPGFTSSQPGALKGLACEREHQLCWTAAPTGATLKALAADGSLARTVTFAASPKDVQALGYFGSRVYVGDIGDAAASRESVTVYRIGTLTDGGVATPRIYSMSYPDQAQDAAAMMVSPRGRIYLVTRGATPGIYRAPAEPASGGRPNALVRVADAPANVTDATFTADGTKMVLRTVNALHVLDPYSFKETAAAELPAEAQGDAVSSSLSGTELLVSGPGDPAPVTSVPLPTTLAAVASSPATPVVASPSATPSTVAESVKEAASTSNRGTWWALVLAGVISLAAAAVVALKR